MTKIETFLAFVAALGALVVALRLVAAALKQITKLTPSHKDDEIVDEADRLLAEAQRALGKDAGKPKL